MNIKEKLSTYKQYKKDVRQLAKYKIFDDSEDKKIRLKMANERLNVWNAGIVVIMLVITGIKELGVMDNDIVLPCFFLMLMLGAIVEGTLISAYKLGVVTSYFMALILSMIVWLLLKVLSKVISSTFFINFNFINYDYKLFIISSLLSFGIVLCKMPMYMLRKLKNMHVLVIAPILTFITSMIVSETASDFLKNVALILLLVKSIIDVVLDRKEKKAQKSLYSILVDDDASISYKELKKCVYDGGSSCLNIIMACDKTRNIVKNNEKIQ